MSEIITVGLDLAKNVFQAHGADGSGRAVLRKKLRRDQVLEFFGRLPCCVVAMEACGGSHFWGREIGKLGHEVRLIPPAYVKPFVKRKKLKSTVVYMDERTPNTWIDLVSTEWTGAIPATLVVSKSRGFERFFEKRLHYDELEATILEALNTP